MSYAAARLGIVDRRRECLEAMTGAADGVIAVTARDDLGRPGQGCAGDVRR